LFSPNYTAACCPLPASLYLLQTDGPFIVALWQEQLLVPCRPV